MRALDLDFRRTKGKVLWPGFALLACSLTVAIVSAQQYQQLAEAAEQAQASLTKRSAAARNINGQLACSSLLSGRTD